jgi:hypothetical protein
MEGRTWTFNAVVTRYSSFNCPVYYCETPAQPGLHWDAEAEKFRFRFSHTRLEAIAWEIRKRLYEQN